MARGECENCKKAIPIDRWCCDECFPYFDGERFLDPEDCEITIIAELGETGEAKDPGREDGNG